MSLYSQYNHFYVFNIIQKFRKIYFTVCVGGENGFVPNIMGVYAVQKKDVTGYYHDNINAEAYLAWFKDLLTELRKTGEKYIIVSF